MRHRHQLRGSTHTPSHRGDAVRLWLLAIVAILTSCGDMLEFQPTVSPYHMEFDRHEYFIMAGDTGRINPIFTPDTISNMTIYWMSDNPLVATVVDNNLIGVAEGETTVTGVSIEYQIYDTCHIYVMPYWGVDMNRGYAFDMMVYAHPTLQGQPLGSEHVVAAFCGDEVRGVGEWREEKDIEFMRFRIYSRLNPDAPFDPELKPQDPQYPDEPVETPEKIVFRLYDHKRHEVYELPDTLLFDGETHGTLSGLYEMKF